MAPGLAALLLVVGIVLIVVADFHAQRRHEQELERQRELLRRAARRLP